MSSASRERHLSAEELAPPLSWFSLESGEGSLHDVLLKAILDDCQTSTQAIRLAVTWGDARITRHQLEESMEEHGGLNHELEEAPPLPRTLRSRPPPPCSKAHDHAPAPPPSSVGRRC